MDRSPAQPVVIGIAGGSGSGKTTVAVRVQERFPQRTVEIVHHDSYYHDHPTLDDAARAAINYDHPAAFETALLDHVASTKADLLDTLNHGDWNDDLEAQLTAVLDDFKATGSW